MPQLPWNKFYWDDWTWNEHDKPSMCELRGKNCRTVHIHPIRSLGTSGVRGTRRLNQGRYYWEIDVGHRIFGTSMMFGIGTDKARLHSNEIGNLLGEDDQSWGLSHKGLVWHNGLSRRYMESFWETKGARVGLFFDGIKGTLEYYKNGRRLGVAFTGLHLVEDSLYPIICSTAPMSVMTLTTARRERRREFINLQDHCRAVILAKLRTPKDVSKLKLPKSLKQYLSEVRPVSECVAKKHRHTMCPPPTKAPMLRYLGPKPRLLYI